MNDRAQIILAGAVLCLAAAVASAQLPDSPTGRRGNALIGAIRGGAAAIDVDFFRQNFTEEYLAEASAEERVEWLRSKIAELGSIGLEGANKTGPFSVVLLGSAETTGQQVKILYEIEEHEPHRITKLDLELADAIEPMSVAQMQSAARDRLTKLDASGGFSGVVLIARGDEVLFEQAYGLANRRYEAPNRIDTAFNLGSINKIFTKIALAQLAAAGKLSFDDTVAQHLPDYPNQEVAGRITIQQVATHTAGLGDIFTQGFSDSSKRRFRAPQDYFELFAQDPLLFEPGEGEQYSNGGYMVLGAIIEAVSGQSYHDYVRQHVFEPAGMNATHPYALDDPMAPFATGYTRMGTDHDEVELHENSFHIPHTGTPAGGGYSTARDLLAFRRAFVAKDLLDGRYSTWVVTNDLPDSAPEARGIGMGIAGGGPGVSATLEMDGEWTLIVLANLDPPSAGEVARGLRELTQAVEKGGG